MQAAVAERWQSVTGRPIVEGYGLTETSPVLTFNPFGRGKLGTIGVPIPSTEIKCVDDAFNEVAPGQPGELACRGPQVMAGYWRRPDETAKVMRGGWLLTGDIAIMDADGYFRIVDRRKDMILVSGFNVFPNEVEDVLAKLAGVKECAVIGVPDGGSGEAPKAFIVRSDPSLTAEAVRAYCKQHLTGLQGAEIRRVPRRAAEVQCRQDPAQGPQGGSCQQRRGDALGKASGETRNGRAGPGRLLGGAGAPTIGGSAGCASSEASQAMPIDRHLPAQELLGGQRVAAARLLEAEEAATDGRHDLCLTPDHPALRAGRR